MGNDRRAIDIVVLRHADKELATVVMKRIDACFGGEGFKIVPEIEVNALLDKKYAEKRSMAD